VTRAARRAHPVDDLLQAGDPVNDEGVETADAPVGAVPADGFELTGAVGLGDGSVERITEGGMTAAGIERG
jgi:hypothetical protein